MNEYEKVCWVQAVGSKGNPVRQVQRARGQSDGSRLKQPFASLTRPGWFSLSLLSRVLTRGWEAFFFFFFPRYPATPAGSAPVPPSLCINNRPRLGSDGSVHAVDVFLSWRLRHQTFLALCIMQGGLSYQPPEVITGSFVIYIFFEIAEIVGTEKDSVFFFEWVGKVKPNKSQYRENLSDFSTL